MRKFIAYILLCINILFGVFISAKPVINNIKKSHDFDYSRQITIKFDLKNETNAKEEMRENAKYIEEQLKKNSEFDYKISFSFSEINKIGMVNVFLTKNDKNFNQISDFLTKKKIELCYENDCISINNDWKINIERNEKEQKIVVSIPKSEITRVHNIYSKSIEDEAKKIEQILKSGLNAENFKKMNNFFIRINFQNGKTKKIILHHETFYPKNQKKDEINKFQIIFPNENAVDEKTYKQYKQEEDIYYYEKIFNSNIDNSNNYEIIDTHNFDEPSNTDLNRKYFNINKIFFVLITTFAIVFIALILMYRFNSIVMIATITLQLFFTICSFIITKQFFNIKSLFGLLIVTLMSLLIYSIQNNYFYKKVETGSNLKNANSEACQKTKSIIFGISIIYLISSFFIFFINRRNINDFGLINIFLINAIIGPFIHFFIFNKLTWLINNSAITQKRYEMFSQFKNEPKIILEKNSNSFLKKEKKIFFIFIITFITSLILVFNFKSFFKEEIFKHKDFTNNIEITLKNNEKSIPYLLDFINKIKIDNQTINFNKNNIKKISYFDKENKYNSYIINLNIDEKDLLKQYTFENQKDSLENILKIIEKKISNATIKLEKEYFYDAEFNHIYLIVIPILIESLFCLYLLIMKYNFSQILCTFFISTITSSIPIIFISFSRVFVEPILILFSTLICMYFSLITCLQIMNENKNNLSLVLKNKNNIRNFDSFSTKDIKNNVLSKTLKNNWEFIGKNLIITNCLFLLLSILEKLTIILFASLIGLFFLIFIIKYFLILFSDQFETLKIAVIKLAKHSTKNKKLLKNQNISQNNEEEIFKGINEY